MNAAKGLMALWGLEAGKAQWSERVSFQSDTPEDLLVVWLEELVYRLSTRGEVWAGGRAVEATGRSLALNASWRALGAGDSSHVTPDCGPLCRLVLAVRLQRVLWRRLIGVRLLVLDSGPSAGVEVTLTGDPR